MIPEQQPTFAQRAWAAMCARSVMQHRNKQPAALSNWLAQLVARAHQNVVIVALANKLLRVAWAVLCKNETYRIPVLAPNC